MKPRSVKILFLSLTSSLLLTACGIKNSKPVIVKGPDIIPYSKGVQDQGAKEMEAAGPPCGRDVVFPGCSVLVRFAIDYGFTRCQTRALYDIDHPCRKKLND